VAFATTSNRLSCNRALISGMVKSLIVWPRCLFCIAL
jgi:hypothetical protein